MLVYQANEKITGSMTKNTYGNMEVFYSYGKPITIIGNATVWTTTEIPTKTTENHRNISLKDTKSKTRIDVTPGFLQDKIQQIDSVAALELSDVIGFPISSSYALSALIYSAVGCSHVSIRQISIDDRDKEITVLAYMDYSSYASALRINKNILTYRNKNYVLEA